MRRANRWHDSWWLQVFANRIADIKVLSRAGKWELKNRTKARYSWDRITVVDANDSNRGRTAVRKCKRASICMTGRYKDMKWLWKEW